VAKGGVINLARAAACELGAYGITVNCLSPGQIPREGDDPETIERFAANVPLGRNGVPTDLQGAALLLASDAGRWMTGHDLVVDGGWSAW
jgi:gluconate 5-dehydrogenase